MSSKRRWPRRLALALAGAAALACVSLAVSNRDRLAQLGRDGSLVGAEVPIVEVTRRPTFTRRVTADGYLEAVEATPVTAPQDSQMPMKIAWIAEEGARIESGDIVVRFDPSEAQRALEDSQGDLDSAMLSIKKARESARSSRSKRDRAAGQAEREIDAASEFQPEDSGVFSRNEVIDSQIDIELSEAKLHHAKSVEHIERRVSDGRLDLLEITRRQAENELARAQEALARLEVAAPHAGVWVLTRDWRGNTTSVGDTVWPGQPLAELPLVSNMQASLFVLEADAGDLEEGLRAELVIEAHPGTTYDAKISRVDALAQPRHEEVPVQYFGVTLAFEQTDVETMKVGARVRATLFIELEDVLVIPRQAVFERGGHFFVHRESDEGDEGFEQVEVVLGPSSAGRVVIESGLDDGDRIALRDPNKRVDELLDDENANDAGESADKGASAK